MKKILIIEDDQIVANIYKNKFAVEAFDVEIAADGATGLEKARSFRPDVVLLDLMLPRLPGIELMKNLRADPEFKDLPIIVFSSTYLTSLVQDAWKEGATKCLSKTNCTPVQLLRVVQSCFESDGDSAPASLQSEPAAATPAPVSQPAAAAPKPRTNHREAAQEAELRKFFVATLPETLKELRIHVQGIVKAETESERLTQMDQLYRRIHSLTGNAAVSGTLPIAQMADALEALLRELYEKPASINASTLRTIASAVDFLAVLFRRDLTSLREIAAGKVLVVDDDAISRRAITYALEKAKLKSVSSDDPVKAFELLSRDRFNLVCLDVDMPNMNGYEFCSKLRGLPAYKKTPVVFVTGLSGFETRANSTMSGGNDFIAKPFLFIELTVKAVIHVLREQLETAKK